MAQMVAPRLRVLLDDDTEYEIQTDNRDLIRFDLTRGRKQWPTMQDAPMLWTSFLAWSCLAREGKLPGVDVEKELDRMISVEVVDENGQAVDVADPAVAEAITVRPS